MLLLPWNKISNTWTKVTLPGWVNSFHSPVCHASPADLVDHYNDSFSAVLNTLAPWNPGLLHSLSIMVLSFISWKPQAVIFSYTLLRLVWLLPSGCSFRTSLLLPLLCIDWHLSKRQHEKTSLQSITYSAVYWTIFSFSQNFSILKPSFSQFPHPHEFLEE